MGDSKSGRRTQDPFLSSPEFEERNFLTTVVLTEPAKFTLSLIHRPGLAVLSRTLSLPSATSSPIPDSHTDIYSRVQNEPTPHPNRAAAAAEEEENRGWVGRGRERRTRRKKGGGRRPIRAGVEGAPTRPVASAAVARIALSQISNYALSRPYDSPPVPSYFQSPPYPRRPLLPIHLYLVQTVR